MDVHLMIVSPESKMWQHLQLVGADILNVHAEACTHLDRVVNQIREEGHEACSHFKPCDSALQ